jgi:hypothetical protein
MITRLGEVSLSSVVPLLAEYQVALTFSGNLGVTELSAKLEGLANVLGAITVAPPSLGATITAALETVASLQAAIGGPTVTLQASAIVALIAELEVQVAALTAALDLAIPDATISAYVYEGPSGSIGVELQSEINGSLPGAGGTAYALILATSSAAAWVQMGLVFRTS